MSGSRFALAIGLSGIGYLIQPLPPLLTRKARTLARPMSLSGLCESDGCQALGLVHTSRWPRRFNGCRTKSLSLGTDRPLGGVSRCAPDGARSHNSGAWVWVRGFDPPATNWFSRYVPAVSVTLRPSVKCPCGGSDTRQGGWLWHGVCHGATSLRIGVSFSAVVLLHLHHVRP